MSGHGWVTPNPDGSKARCGGPAVCSACALEKAAAEAAIASRLNDAASRNADSGPAETMRHAAALMREQHGPEHVRHKFWHALADWLDAAAQAWDEHMEWDEALNVARAYLGEVTS